MASCGDIPHNHASSISFPFRLEAPSVLLTVDFVPTDLLILRITIWVGMLVAMLNSTLFKFQSAAMS